VPPLVNRRRARQSVGKRRGATCSLRVPLDDGGGDDDDDDDDDDNNDDDEDDDDDENNVDRLLLLGKLDEEPRGCESVPRDADDEEREVERHACRSSAKWKLTSGTRVARPPEDVSSAEMTGRPIPILQTTMVI